MNLIVSTSSEVKANLPRYLIGANIKNELNPDSFAAASPAAGAMAARAPGLAGQRAAVTGLRQPAHGF